MDVTVCIRTVAVRAWITSFFFSTVLVSRPNAGEGAMLIKGIVEEPRGDQL